MIFLMLLSGWSVITGDVIHPEGGFHDIALKNLKGYQAKIPSYWFEASKWLNSKERDFRVLLTPQNPFLSVRYDWYLGVDRTYKFVYKPLVTIYPGGLYIRNEIALRLAQAIYNELRSNSTSLVKLLALFNIKYILQRNDLDWTHFGNPLLAVSSPVKIRQILLSKRGIQIIKSFGKLDIYEIDDNFFAPHIYVARNISFLERNISIENPWGTYKPDISWKIKKGYLRKTSNDITYVCSNISTSIISTKLKINSDEYSYLLIKFKTNNRTAIAVQINPSNLSTLSNKGYLYAINKVSTRNTYSSTEWSVLVFKLYENITINNIKIFLIPCSKIEDKYVLEAWISSVIFAKSISYIDTIVKMIKSENFNIGNTVILSKNTSALSLLNYSNSSGVYIIFKRINPTNIWS